jgi:hypothetical protein
MEKPTEAEALRAEFLEVMKTMFTRIVGFISMVDIAAINGYS